MDEPDKVEDDSDDGATLMRRPDAPVEGREAESRAPEIEADLAEEGLLDDDASTSIRRPEASEEDGATLMRVPELPDEESLVSEIADRPEGGSATQFVDTVDRDAASSTADEDELVAEFATRPESGSATQFLDTVNPDAPDTAPEETPVHEASLDDDLSETAINPALSEDDIPDDVGDDEAATIRAVAPRGGVRDDHDTDVIGPGGESAGDRIAREARLGNDDTSWTFELDHRIAQGGMADVFLGRDRSLETKRAIKLVKTHLLTGRDGEEFARRFRAEAETVARLRHAHIVQVQALTTIRGRPAIVMEYLEGGNLADRIKQGALPLSDSLTLMLAMADALAYAHKLEIVHRDFKPANIMYTADGMPVLTDFGIARANVEAGGTSTHTVVGTVIGTANYMAPEQALGKAVGPAADMYAFGKVLFEVLTSKLPPAEASRGSDEDRIEAILGRFVDMRASHARPIAELVAKCLDPNEDLRPTAKDARNALQDLVDKLDEGSGFARYKPALIGLGIGASAAIAIVAGISILGGDTQPAPATDGGATAVVEAPTTPWLTRLRAAMPAGATLHLDGTPLAPDLETLPETGRKLVIVAPGHLGRIVDLSEPAPSVAALTLGLLPEPSFDEWSAVFDPARTQATLQAISDAKDAETAGAFFRDPTLTLLAELLWLEEHASSALTARVESLRALERLGDASVAVALYSASMETDTNALEAAAEHYGFAAATWASHLRDVAGLPASEYAPWFERARTAGLDAKIVETWGD